MSRRSLFKLLGSFVIGTYLGLGVKKLEIRPDIQSDTAALLLIHKFEAVMFEAPPSLYDFFLEQEKINYP